jgi:cytochrome b561
MTLGEGSLSSSKRARPHAESGYGATAKLLHWTLAVLLTAQYIVGAAMPHVRRTTPQEGLVAWHVSIGTAVLLFALLGFAWWALRPVPIPLNVPAWQRHVARLTHLLLYLLTILMGFLGWAASSYNGWPVRLFGVIPLPALAAKGTAWAHTAGDVHDVLLYVLLALIALHVAAALYHHFVRHDEVLARMRPCG